MGKECPSETMSSIKVAQPTGDSEPVLCFTDLAKSQLKVDNVSECALLSAGNNISYIGANGEGMAFQLKRINQSFDNFPFSISYVKIPRDQPTNAFVKEVEISKIYDQSIVEDGEALTLDPMYMVPFSREVQKAYIVHMDWSPIKLSHTKKNHTAPVLAILTSYGYCALYEQTTLSRQWRKISCCINSCLNANIFPITKKPEDVKNFSEFKQFVDLYWLTAFAWDVAVVKPILYIANAAGYIIALEFTSDYQEVSERCRLLTNMGRISYLRTNGSLLIASSITGVVNVFEVQSGTAASIEYAECLWRYEDRMAIRHGVFIPVTDSKSVLVFFAKGNYLRGFRLSSAGKIECSSALHAGFKVTGLEQLDNISLIIVTITGTIRHICFNNSKTDDLNICEKSCVKTIWGDNFQILGLATTKYRCLWSFLLFRNKLSAHKCKYGDKTAFIRVCKSNRSEPIQLVLSTSPEIALDTCIDSLTLMGLEILNRNNAQKYKNFCQLETLTQPEEWNTEFLHLLQIKWLLLKYTERYENLYLKIINTKTASYLEFLTIAIMLVYIFCTLKAMESDEVNFCDQFSIAAVSKMCMKFDILLIELNKLIRSKTSVSYLNETIEMFQTQITEEYQKLKSPLKPKENDEKCLICQDEIDASTLKCAAGHAVERCAITALQLPIFKRFVCQFCNVAVLDAPGMLRLPIYKKRCIYCRFSLLESDMIL